MAASSLFLWASSFSLARVRNFFRCEAQSIQQRVHGLAQLHCGFVHPKIVEVASKLKEHRERLKLCLPLLTPVKGPQGRYIRHLWLSFVRASYCSCAPKQALSNDFRPKWPEMCGAETDCTGC